MIYARNAHLSRGNIHLFRPVRLRPPLPRPEETEARSGREKALIFPPSKTLWELQDAGNPRFWKFGSMIFHCAGILALSTFLDLRHL